MRSASLVVLVVGLAVVLSAGVSAVGGSTGGAALPAATPTATPTPTPGSTDGNATNATDAGLGPHISSFMQSNAAQASGAVETGMWIARYENASNASRGELVRGRTDRLRDRLEGLRAEKRALLAAKRNGSIDAVTYRARLSRLVGRLAALGGAVDAADRRAAAIGVNRTALADLRSGAAALSGPEVREIARSLAGRSGDPPGPPGWVTGTAGPPDRKGGPSDGAGRSNRSRSAAVGPSNGTGPPDDAGNGKNADGGGSAGGPPAGEGSNEGNRTDRGRAPVAPPDAGGDESVAPGAGSSRSAAPVTARGERTPLAPL